MLIEDLRHAYGGQNVLTGVTVELLRHARVGIVGANGAGKSTLLRLMAGLDTPTGGRVSVPRGSRVVYVAQEPEVDPVASVFGDALSVFADLRAMERALAELARALAEAACAAIPSLRRRYDELQHTFDVRGGYTYEATVRRVLTGLGLPERYWNRRAAGLSGGERARLALAKALLQEPDILLLDEPTNHLDMASLDWLENFLLSWRGSLAAVSHDRYFLDRVVEHIWEVRDGHVDAYPGNYSQFARLRAERDRRRQELYERQQAEIARTEEFIRRNKAGQRAKEARGRQTRLARLERLEAVRRQATVKLNIDHGLRSGRVVLRLTRFAVEHPGRRGEAIITAPSSVELERGQRVALVGPNGSGKTTLLRTILGELAPLTGRAEAGEGVKTAVFRQGAEDLNPEDDVLTAFLEPRNRPIAEARDILARFLFRGEDIWKRVGDLSGGERSRLALARLFGCGANFLLLDEPTNHLDLPSREALESVLPRFPGALLFVSHDRRFIDAVATHIWSLESGQLVPFTGNWTAFVSRGQTDGEGTREAPAMAMPDHPAPARSLPASGGVMRAGTTDASADGAGDPPPPPAARDPRAAGRAARAEERRTAARVRDLEREVTEAERALARLQDELAAATAHHDVARIAELGQAVVEAEARLHARIAEWEAAALAAGV